MSSAATSKWRRLSEPSRAEGEVGELWEDWMRHVDDVLDDPQLLDVAYEALARRWTHSRTCGRRGTPVDVVIRMLVLKHMRNWSYAALEREVRAKT
jgi:IS5 family transposase